MHDTVRLKIHQQGKLVEMFFSHSGHFTLGMLIVNAQCRQINGNTLQSPIYIACLWLLQNLDNEMAAESFLTLFARG